MIESIIPTERHFTACASRPLGNNGTEKNDKENEAA